MRNDAILKPKHFCLSATKVSKFYECAKCYILEYELQVEWQKDKKLFDYGTQIHDSIEEYIKTDNISDRVVMDDTKQEMFDKRMSQIREDFSQDSKKLSPEVEFLIETHIDNPYFWSGPNEPKKLWFYWFFDIIKSFSSNYYARIKAVRLTLNNELTVYDTTWKEYTYHGQKPWIDALFTWNTEIKTGKRRSYSMMKTSPQFLLYAYVLKRITWLMIPQKLYNYVVDWSTQNENIPITEKDIEIFMNHKVKDMIDALQNRTFPKESSCWFFSAYSAVCPGFTISR